MNKEDFYHFDVYQDCAARTAIYPSQGSNPYYPALGLAGETGEVCEKLKKVMRDKGGVFSPEDVDQIALEMSDVLWYLSALCCELNIPMSQLPLISLKKLEDRQKRDVIKGSGDNR